MAKREGNDLKFHNRIRWARKAGASRTTLALTVLMLTVEGGCVSSKQLEEQAWRECDLAEGVGPCDAYLNAFPGGLHAAVASDKKYGLMWKDTEREDSIRSYRSFLDQVPKTYPNYSVAAARLGKLETEDNAAWARALKGGTVSAFEQYLRRRGTPIHAEEAAKRLDDKLWQVAKSSDTDEAYQKYLNAQPNGAHVEEARQELNPASMRNCILRKLRVQGYHDRIDCIMNYKNPICQNISRYNAEVDAYNGCK